MEVTDAAQEMIKRKKIGSWHVDGDNPTSLKPPKFEQAGCYLSIRS